MVVELQNEDKTERQGTKEARALRSLKRSAADESSGWMIGETTGYVCLVPPVPWMVLTHYRFADPGLEPRQW